MDQCAELEEYAECQFSVAELAVLLKVTEDDLRDMLRDPKHKEAAAYDRGRLRAQAAVRMAILEAAKNGSTPAQRIFADMMSQAQAEIEELRSGDFDGLDL